MGFTDDDLIATGAQVTAGSSKTASVGTTDPLRGDLPKSLGKTRAHSPPLVGYGVGLAGMGGYESSRWRSHWTRDTTDGLRRLDVRELARCGQLRPGTRSRWSWTRYGQLVAEIDLDARTDALLLDYRIKRPADPDGRTIAERIALDFTPCHFGGSRPWFRCPGCGRRRAVLYSVSGRFRCMGCHDLAHASTRGPKRSQRLADKPRMQLGVSSSAAPRRPPLRR